MPVTVGLQASVLTITGAKTFNNSYDGQYKLQIKSHSVITIIQTHKDQAVK